jgi:predicted GNAT family N-acyltransferase
MSIRIPWAIRSQMGETGAPCEELEIGLAQPADQALCLAIRRRVFIEEQGVPEALELDEFDEEAVCWIARISGRAVGTARARLVEGYAKAERVAVLPELRRRGVGRALMDALEAWAFGRGLDRVGLNAQESAIAFYRTLGYRVTGEPFEEAGIPHRAMTKRAAKAGK